MRCFLCMFSPIACLCLEFFLMPVSQLMFHFAFPLVVSPYTPMSCISCRDERILLGKICDATAITSPGRILTLFFLSHFTCFYGFFSWLNWISGPAADFGSISPKKKHGYFSTCSQLCSQQPAACLRYVLFALLEMDNNPFASVLSYLDNRSVHVSH